MKNTGITLLLVLTAYFGMAQTNNCLDFDGVDDYVLIGDVNDLGTSDFTIESWIYIESTVGNGNKIISKGITSVGTPSNAGYALRASKLASDEIEFHIGNSDGTVKRVFHNGIATNTWYHVAGVRSKTKLYLYLDGELVAEDSTATVYDVDTDIPLSIGAIHKGDMSPVNEFMTGKIDEARIWTVARSESEINDHKDCAITSAESGLLAVYNFNEADGINAADSSGNENSGDVIGEPIWVDSPVAPICISTTGIEESNTNALIIYPNPFQNEININGTFTNAAITVYDIAGNKVLSGPLTQNKIDVSALASGAYILEVSNDTLTKRVKIIRE